MNNDNNSENIGIIELSVIIPVFNNEKTISITLKNIISTLRVHFSNFEIIVVDDGSIDQTSKIVLIEKEKNSEIKLVSYQKNKGKGYAVRTGVLKSIGKTVIYIDGDFEIHPKDITEYVKETKKFDLVIASKYHPMSIVNVSFSRKIFSRMFIKLVRFITKLKIHDTQAGLKAGKGNVMRELFNLIRTNRFAFDVELLILCKKKNLLVKEMPVKITLDKHFKIKDALRMLYDVLLIASRRNS